MIASFDICCDAEWVARLMSQPDIVEISFPDDTEPPTAEQISTAMNAGGLDFVRICYDSVPLGFFLLELKYPDVEIHTVIEKAHRGASAFSAAKAFPDWFFENYQECEALITQVPKYNRAAALFAMRGGMKKSDSQGDIFTKNGESDHMDIYVIKRGA